MSRASLNRSDLNQCQCAARAGACGPNLSPRLIGSYLSCHSDSRLIAQALVGRTPLNSPASFVTPETLLPRKLSHSAPVAMIAPGHVQQRTLLILLPFAVTLPSLNGQREDWQVMLISVDGLFCCSMSGGRVVLRSERREKREESAQRGGEEEERGEG